MKSMDDKRKKSIEFFRVPPCNYTCAQAILKGFQNEFLISEAEVDAFIEYRGGRAPEGICGAVYAANHLLGKVGKDGIDEDFEKISGSVKCLEIKSTYHFPCPECIKLADKLIEEKIK